MAGSKKVSVREFTYNLLEQRQKKLAACGEHQTINQIVEAVILSGFTVEDLQRERRIRNANASH